MTDAPLSTKLDLAIAKLRLIAVRSKPNEAVTHAWLTSDDADALLARLPDEPADEPCPLCAGTGSPPAPSTIDHCPACFVDETSTTPAGPVWPAACSSDAKDGWSISPEYLRRIRADMGWDCSLETMERAFLFATDVVSRRVQSSVTTSGGAM